MKEKDSEDETINETLLVEQVNEVNLMIDN